MKLYNIHSIKYQIPLLAALLIAMLITSVYFTTYLRGLEHIEHDIENFFKVFVDRVEERFEQRISQNLKKDIDYIRFSPLVEQYFDSSKTEQRFHRNSIEKMLRRIIKSHGSNIVGISIYDSHGQERMALHDDKPKRSHWQNLTTERESFESKLYYVWKADMSKDYSVNVDYDAKIMYVLTPIESPLYELNRGVLVVRYDLMPAFAYAQTLVFEGIPCVWVFNNAKEMLVSPPGHEYISSPAKLIYDEVTERKVYFDSSGYFVVAPIKFAEDMSALFYIGVGLSPKFLKQKFEPFHKDIIYIIATSLLAVLILGYVVRRTIINPCLQMANAVRKVEQGEKIKPEEFVVNVNNEIGILGNQFASMLTELHNQHVSLEKMVTEKTEELQHAKEIAESANVAKSMFLENVSHEVRTPLSGLLGILDLLNKDELTAKQREMLNVAYKSGQHLLLLINDVIDFSRVTSGNIELKKREFNLLNMCETLITSLEPVGIQKSIDIKLLYNLQDPIFVGDEERLRQIIYCLMGNALKFTFSGYVQLEVNCKKEFSNKSMLEFKVTDTGIGIKKELLPDIFDIFNVEKANIDRQHTGSGLGLSICKELVNLMSGTIAVNSVVDVGTTFEFTAVLGHASESKVAEINKQNEVLSDLDKLKGTRILLVEDNQSSIDLISYILEKYDINLDIAQDGLSAVEKTLDQKYDIILMDCLLPELDGFSATTEIKNNRFNVNHKTPIIAITAIPTSTIQERCIESGMNDFIAKPFKSDELLCKMIINL